MGLSAFLGNNLCFVIRSLCFFHVLNGFSKFPPIVDFRTGKGEKEFVGIYDERAPAQILLKQSWQSSFDCVFLCGTFLAYLLSSSNAPPL